ncbi:P-loop containing nucleoside triphosphate hydrolase protein [Crepidotus variabilis]|uniref:P-loop containing nucleoside triphosphate hydrolase protein n=1 Tax=Crepidotus variabilis TaxID=179855 RepID=A0A9P6JNZ4_9AGAR|nr:P-loop containing nucleoside triphosphate hydrolase protein [Crepidotus variabilis]
MQGKTIPLRTPDGSDAYNDGPPSRRSQMPSWAPAYRTPERTPVKRGSSQIKSRPPGLSHSSEGDEETASVLYPMIPLDLRDVRPYVPNGSLMPGMQPSPPPSPLLVKGKSRALSSFVKPTKSVPEGIKRELRASLRSLDKVPDYFSSAPKTSSYSPVNAMAMPEPIVFPVPYASTNPFYGTTSPSHYVLPNQSSRDFSPRGQVPSRLPSTPQKSSAGTKLSLGKLETTHLQHDRNIFQNNQLPTPITTPVRFKLSKSNANYQVTTPNRATPNPEEQPPPYFNFDSPTHSRLFADGSSGPSHSENVPPAFHTSNKVKVEAAATINDIPPCNVEIKVEAEIKASTSTMVDIDALARKINRRLVSPGLRDKQNIPGWDDKPEDSAPPFLHDLPKKVPKLLFWAGMAIFANGHSLKPFQGVDLQRLLKREKGEKVCGTEVINSVGYLIGYPMGYGKTVLTLALILLNMAPKGFKGSRATLVLCPTQGIMINWRSEIEKFAPSLSVCFFDSSSVPLDTKADVILMTYDQLRFQRRCFLKPTKNCKGHIFLILFWRIVCDESACFRNPDTKLAAAVTALKKQHGLCLSGTPVQNSWRDLFVTLVFLGIVYRGLNNLETFDRLVYAKRQKGPIINPISQQILDTILQYFVIQRPVVDPITGKELVSLPKRTDTTVVVELGKEERSIYDLIKNLPESVFARLTRRRQACDHPKLLTHFLDATAAEFEIEIKQEDEEESEIFEIVKSDSRDIYSAAQWPLELRRCFSDDFVSAKFATVKKILLDCTSGQKTIIFTSFVQLIPAILSLLSKIKVQAVQYTGDMTVMQRDSALKKIATDDSCTVIIVSLMAGGTGLNITACDTVIVLEPWWNPYAEEQAIARAHRIGQTRPVHVYHLVTKDSIEESILKTQLLKRQNLGGLYGTFSAPDEVDYATWLAGP